MQSPALGPDTPALSPDSGVIGPAFCRHARRLALDALYRNERATILAYLACRVGSEHAHDLTQEVFLRLASSKQLLLLENPPAYLHRIARNAAIDFSRRMQRQVATLPICEEFDAPCRPDQDERLQLEETLKAIQAAIAEMPVKTARVFSMNRFEHKTYREIQHELGIALPTVDYHMMKALGRLRSALGKGD
ncbi:sigma-70 family RNA polymerase sigma factor [Erythrobacter sp.]|uniref:RNA polymerase sigma factor n=1 Tax=Erythrobacter sp. TaxID=1042 RepID=UPI0031204DB3